MKKESLFIYVNKFNKDSYSLMKHIYNKWRCGLVHGKNNLNLDKLNFHEKKDLKSIISILELLSRYIIEQSHPELKDIY